MSERRKRVPGPIEQAAGLAEDVHQHARTDGITDAEAIELAKVYTAIATVQAFHRIAAAVEGAVDALSPLMEAITAAQLTQQALTLAELHPQPTEGVEVPDSTDEETA